MPMPVWVVTGGSGFLGAHLLARLASAAARGRRRRPAIAQRAGRGASSGRTSTIAPRSPGRWANSGPRSSSTWRAGRRRPSPTSSTGATPWRRSPGSTPSARSIAPSGWSWPGRRGSWGRSRSKTLPVGEDWTCRPLDPYGLSKWLATAAGAGGPAAAGGRRRADLQPDRAGAAGVAGPGPLRPRPWPRGRGPDPDRRRPRRPPRLRRRPRRGRGPGRPGRVGASRGGSTTSGPGDRTASVMGWSG